MTFEANGNLLDIEAEHGNNIEAPKLAAFKTSLASIEGRTSTANTNLCAWKASNTAVPIKASPSQNQTTIDTGANQAEQAYRQKETREKAKSKYKHIILDYNTIKEEVTRHGSYLTAQDPEINI